MANHLTVRLANFAPRRVTLNQDAHDGRPEVQQSWREAGQGDALVLLHGISSGSGSWLQQLETLSSGFRVLAWDAPGYGDSDPLRKATADVKTDGGTKGATEDEWLATPKASDYATRLKSWLDQLGIQRCWLVGHSLGALQAAAFAHLWPERLWGVVLASPAQGYGGQDKSVQERVRLQRPAKLAELGPEGLARDRAAALLSSAASADQVALIADGMKRLKMPGFSASSALLAGDDIHRYLPFQVPAMVMCGSADTITPPQPAEQLAEALAESGFCQYQPVEAAGHVCYVESPDAVNQNLLRFIARAKPEQNTAAAAAAPSRSAGSTGIAL